MVQQIVASHSAVLRVPAGMFGIVLGVSGLAGDWRLANALWGLPSNVGEMINACAIVIWAVLIALFAAKWLFAREAALEEARHPIHCCFIGLAGVATMLVARGVLPYSRGLALVLFGLGVTFSMAFALWRTGTLWRGGRDPATTTAVLYLPTVAACLVSALVMGALGMNEWAQLAFGAGLLSWLAIESVLVQRLLTAPEMAPALRPSLGIILAPPAVGCAAYLSITTGPPDMLANALLGYCLLQVLVLLRILPWIMKQPFATSYWATTFGTTALAAASMRMSERGGTGAAADLAPLLFILANVAVGSIAAGTVYLATQGRLIAPQPTVVDEKAAKI
jgi:tellurite resistance protein